MSHHEQRRLEREARRSEQAVFQPIEQAEDTRITPDMTAEEIELRVRRRVEKRQGEISSFIASLGIYLAVNIGLWVIYLTTTRNFFFFPWPIFPSFFWGLGVLTQGYRLYQNSLAMVARRESNITRQVERMKAQMGLETSAYYGEKPKNTEKPKNDQRPQPMRLTDDGEIIPADAEIDDSDADLTTDPRYMNSQRGQNNQ